MTQSTLASAGVSPSSRRRTPFSWATLAVTVAIVAAPGFAAAPAVADEVASASAADTTPAAEASGVLTASKTSGLDPSGETVRVAGVGFEAGLGLVLATCDAAAEGGVCDAAHAELVTVGPDGAFTQDLMVGAFAGADCVIVTCAIRASEAAQAGEPTQEVSLALSFTDPAPAEAPRVETPVVEAPVSEAPVAETPLVEAPAIEASSGDQPSPEAADQDNVVPPAARLAKAGLKVSKTSGLSPAGETVNVTGSGFEAGVGLFVALCNVDVPAGGACDMANFAQVQTDGSGGFSTSMKVLGTFSSAGGTVTCGPDPCAIQTSKVGDGANTSQTVTVPMSFSTDTGQDDTEQTDEGTDDGAGTGSGTDTGTDSASNPGSTGTSESTGETLPATGATMERTAILGALLMLVLGCWLAMGSRPRRT